MDDLIARTAQGDRAAFDALYDATSARLYALCVSLLKDRPLAEDTLRAVYVAIWRGTARPPAQGMSALGWLTTLARGAALDRRRARVPSADAPPPPADTHSGPPVEALARLDSVRAGFLRDIYLNGLSYTDLAAREDVPSDELRGWLRQGLLGVRA